MDDHPIEAMNCLAKHTKYQPDEYEFKCPKCGAGPGDESPFVIYESDEDSADDCALIHNDDYLMCDRCGYEATGRSAMARLAREASLVTCPTCKGKGMVKA